MDSKTLILETDRFLKVLELIDPETATEEFYETIDKCSVKVSTAFEWLVSGYSSCPTEEEITKGRIAAEEKLAEIFENSS